MHDLMKMYMKRGGLRLVNSGSLFIFRHSPDFLRRWGAYTLNAVNRRGANRTKFLIFAQGRTGSTLLVDLLNSHPEIVSFGEIFDIVTNVKYPLRYAEGICSLSKRRVCGFKVKIYQMERRTRKDPGAALTEFHEHGWKIIYLKRSNLLQHAVSDIRSEKTKHWHNVGPEQRSKSSKKVSIGFDELIEVMKFREDCLNREQQALGSLPHLTIEYETDLQDSDAQPAAMSRVFEFLDLSAVEAKTDFRKVTPKNIADILENYDELEKEIKKTPYAHFLDGL